MKKHIYTLSLAALLSAPLIAQDASKAKEAQTEAPKTYPSPNAIVDAAPASEWIAIKQSDLLIMDLAPDRDGKERRVIIQLMPDPFSQGWVRNIRKLADAKFWDDTAIIRVQDNYVTQWGDPNGGEDGAKPLPRGLEAVPESEYVVENFYGNDGGPADLDDYLFEERDFDKYRSITTRYDGWQIARAYGAAWPVHCYGMVGVGRNLSPDTGDGSSLYTVIGHAPRHLDRNIALVGRIISGMEYMSSLPRGSGALGFYETAEERTKIVSVRMGNEVNDVPKFEYLSTEGATFAKYADARANRRDPFFNVPAGGADICNIPVPIREKSE